MSLLTAIDLFAGAGGLSEGMEQAGVDIAWANEKNSEAALTYAYNHPKTILCQKDIKSVDTSEIKKMVGEIDIVAGGPPCQGFSLAGRRDINDPRNYLFKEFLRIVNGIKPPLFVLENVKGLLSFDKGRFMEKIVSHFKNAGYSTQLNLLNASSFGVPQMRERIFLVGTLDKKMEIVVENEKAKVVSTREAIGDLGFLNAGESIDHYKWKPRTDYQKKMRDSKTLHNHAASNHGNKVKKRFALIKPGAGMKSLPLSMRTCKNVQYKLFPNAPSRTLTTLPEDLIHYSKNRILTVREMARLQSFPDSYVFLGPRTTGGAQRISSCPQYTQVGNAVPPMLAKAVFTSIVAQLS